MTQDTVGKCFEAWGQDIWRLLSILGVPERELLDATHDVFLAAHRRWDDFNGSSSRKTWLVGIALNVARNTRRRHARAGEDAALNGVDTDLAAENPSPASDPFEVTARAESLQLLKRLLERRTAVERQLLVLCFVQEMSVVEAATLLQLSESKARYTLTRAQESLLADLERHRARDEWRLR